MEHDANTGPGPIERGADLVHSLLATLDALPAGRALDPSHRERLSSVEEACRLVADAAAECPRALRGEGLSAFRGLVTRLAMEVEDPSRQAGAFRDDPHLAGLEAAHGSLSAALHGLSAAIGLVEAAAGAGRRPAPRPFGADGLGRVSREGAHAWARRVDAGLVALEREVLRAPASPALRRDAWGVACGLAIATAQVADNACIEIGPALERLSDAGAILAQAVAVLASEASASGREFGGPQASAVLALVPVVDGGMALVREALVSREASRAHVAWRLLSRGRSRLDDRQVEAIVGRAVSGLPHANAARSVSYAQALARAAGEFRTEWARGPALEAIA